MNNKSSKKIISYSIIGIILLVLALSFSYAATFVTKESERNYIKAGQLYLEFIDDTNVLEPLNVDKALDTNEGMNQSDCYSFTIENKGDVTLDFEISLLDDEEYLKEIDSSKILDPKYVSYHLVENGFVHIPSNLKGQNDVILKGRLNAYEKKTYELRLWIDKNSILSEEDQIKASNKIFAKKVSVYAYQADV